MALRPIVKNAADPKQVKRAERMAKRQQERFDGALKAVLSIPQGRYVLNAIIEDAGMLRSSYDSNGSFMYFKEGRRSYGLEIRAACVEVDEESVLLMDQEATAQRRQDQREIDAGHTASASDSEGENHG